VHCLTDRRGLTDDVRTLRDDFGVMAAILRRIDHNLTACRDELRQFLRAAGG